VSVTIEQDNDGVYVAHYGWQTYRYLMNDGRLCDVVALRDDSDLRQQVVKTMAEGRDIEGVAIEGVACLGEAEP
jgi:hypothetical protein